MRLEIDIHGCRRYYYVDRLVLTAVYLGYFSIEQSNPNDYFAVSSSIEAYSPKRIKGTWGIYHTPQTIHGCERIYSELVTVLKQEAALA
jgi:hypothetical protein